MSPKVSCASQIGTSCPMVAQECMIGLKRRPVTPKGITLRLWLWTTEPMSGRTS